jgi:hypothetical protein
VRNACLNKGASWCDWKEQSKIMPENVSLSCGLPTVGKLCFFPSFLYILIADVLLGSFATLGKKRPLPS